MAIRTYFCSLVLICSAGLAAGAFHIEDRWKIGGDGGWGYPTVDAGRHFLYVPRTDRLAVVDTKTGLVVAEVKGMIDTRRVALDAAGNFGYATDIGDGSSAFVRVFDRKLFAVVASIPAGRDPDAIVFEPATAKAIAFNAHGHSATAIDTSNRVSTTIALPDNPGFAVVDGTGAVFVSLRASNRILRIDARSGNISGTWATGDCVRPTGLAMDLRNRRVLASCENHEIVSLDPENGSVTKLTNADVGSGGIGFDAKAGLLFCGDASGALTVLRWDGRDGFSLEQKIATAAGARVFAIDEAEGRVYLPVSKFGERTGPQVSEELAFRPTPVAGTFGVIVVGR